MPETLYGVIQQNLEADPSHICLVWPKSGTGESIKVDAKTLLHYIDAYTQFLNLRNFVAGSAILIAAAPSREMIGAILAVFRAGGMAVLPPAGAKMPVIIKIIRQHNIRHIAVQKRPGIVLRLMAKLCGVQFIVPATDMSPLKNNITIPGSRSISYGKGGLISHSSGSTGIPKTIRRPYEILYAQHLVLKTIFPPWPHQVDFPLFPNVVLHNLACGVTSVLPDIPGFRVNGMNPEWILHQIAAQKVQTLTGNVFYFKHLLQQLQSKPQTFLLVKAIGIGGSPVPEYLLPALKIFFPAAELYIIYGSSEAEPIAVRRVNNIQSLPADGYFVGDVYTNLEINIHVSGSIILPGGRQQEVGEIAVRGAHVAVSSAGEWLMTSDFGYLQGRQLYLTGRKGNERIHNGVQHYQVEHCLAQLPGIDNVAAIAGHDGFTIFIQGKCEEAIIMKKLYTHFNKIKINAVTFHNELPLDKRHHSKIRYELLK